MKKCFFFPVVLVVLLALAPGLRAQDCATRFSQGGPGHGAFDAKNPAMVEICRAMTAAGAPVENREQFFCGHGYGEDTNKYCLWQKDSSPKFQDTVALKATPVVGNVEGVRRSFVNYYQDPMTEKEEGGVRYITYQVPVRKHHSGSGNTLPASVAGFMCRTTYARVKQADKLGRTAACKGSDCWIGVKIEATQTSAESLSHAILKRYIEQGLCMDAQISGSTAGGEGACPEGYLDDGNGVCVAADSGTAGIQLSPRQVSLPADGRSTHEFTLSLTREGKPLAGEMVSLSLEDPRGILADPGQTLPATITDQNGKATFVFHAPRFPQNFPARSHDVVVQARHALGNPKARITLTDNSPRISVQADPRTIQEGDSSAGVSYLTVTIDDPGSSSWQFEATAALGQVVMGHKGIPAKGSSTQNRLNLRWVRPDSKVGLRDFEFTLDRDDAAAWQAFSGNMKKALVSLTQDQEDKTRADWESYANDMKGSLSYIKEDVQRLESGTHSGLETFLNMLSTGFEGHQVWMGSKGMYDSAKDYAKNELGMDTGSQESLGGRVKNAVEGARDALYGYSIDLLQARLRSWADAIHEANLNTLRLPVAVTVRVRDDQGFEAVKTIVLQYTYHYNPKVHLDKINNPEAG